MTYSPEEIAAVREATDLVALVGEVTQLKRVGTRYVGLCPFHDERTASFTVSPEKGLYHCFGCQASGDAVGFVERTAGVGFREALELLAARAGITLTEQDAPSESRAVRDLKAALAAAADHYSSCLSASPTATAWLESRGISAGLAERFRVGYAPGGGALVEAVGLPVATLQRAGLLRRDARARLVEVFHDRIVFPIADVSGAVIAFGGRYVGSSDDAPKYVNSAESELYHKSKVLYGLDRARGEVVRRDCVVVCEGYTDVIGFFAAGVANAVATCGTALTEDHLKALRRFTQHVLFAFDADAAGETATERAAELAGRAAMQASVAVLAPGTDPAEMARTDPEALARAVAEATPLVGWLVERRLSGIGPRAPVEPRVAAAEAAARVVATHPNERARRVYVREISERTGVPERDIARLARAAVARPAPPPPLAARTSSWERDAEVVIAVAIDQPGAVAHLLHESTFPPGPAKRAFTLLCASKTLDEAIERARDDPETTELFYRMAVAEPLADATGAIARLAEHALARAVNEAAEAVIDETDEAAARRADEHMARLERLLARLAAGDVGAIGEATAELARPSLPA